MNISNREKGLSFIFVIVAIFVLYNFLSEDINGESTSDFSGNRSVSSRSINRYKKIKPYPDITSFKKKFDFSTPERNIFQYGRNNVENNKTDEEISDQQKRLEEKMKQDALMFQEVNENTENVPIPPSIDFEVKGMFETKRSKAIVITKGAELFVIKEHETFFDQFIVKEISRERVKIGFKGFENIKEIPFKNTRGF